MSRKRRSTLSTVVSLMSEETQQRLQEEPLLSTVPIAEIRPDPGQPRRLLPPDLQQQLDRGQLDPLTAVRKWVDRARAEEADPGLIRHVRELRKLADSIEQHGLINPISVRRPLLDEQIPKPVAYLIVTGERRYWAHALLASEARSIQEGERTVHPDEIKVTLAAEGISVRGHQLIENLIREDINAIEKASGMWALRLELSEVNHGSPEPMDLEELVRLESSGRLVSWSVIEEALGISKRYRIYVTSVLQLAPEAQALVQLHNLSERMIRPIVQKLRDYPQLQIAALEQLIAWQAEDESESGRSLVGSVKRLVDELLAQQSKEPHATARRELPPTVGQLRRRVRGVLRFLDGLEPSDREVLSSRLSTANGLEKELLSLRGQIDQLLSYLEHNEAAH